MNPNGTQLQPEDVERARVLAGIDQAGAFSNDAQAQAKQAAEQSARAALNSAPESQHDHSNVHGEMYQKRVDELSELSAHLAEARETTILRCSADDVGLAL